MAPESKTRKMVVFGPYLLDPVSGELWKNGTKLKLGEQPFQILLLLLQAHGELVNREELQAQLWADDTFVDFDRSLNSAVQRLRDILCDTAEKARWIETVPRRGYRFVGQAVWSDNGSPHELLPPPGNGGANSTSNHRALPASDLDAELQRLTLDSDSGRIAALPLFGSFSPTRPSPWARLGWLGFMLLAVVLAAVFYAQNHFPKAAHSILPLQHKQVTFVGYAYEPGISRDGMYVAYVDRHPGEEERLVTQSVSGGPSLELLHRKVVESPIWSPDGSELAFAYVHDKDAGVSILSRFGGDPRRLSKASYACWSPDGSEVLVTSQNSDSSIRWASKLTGEEKVVPAPTYEWLTNVDCSMKTGDLLLTTQTGEKYQVWSMHRDGSGQHKLIEGGKELLSAQWSGSGDSVYYLIKEGDTTDLMKLPASERPSAPSVLASGLETGGSFTLSSGGSELAYTRVKKSSNLWIAALPTHRASAKIHMTPLTSGTQFADQPNISPDGRWVVFTVGSDTKSNVYKMPIEGGQPVQLTFFDSARSSNPAWSPDGKRIAFICDRGGVPKVWVMNTDGTDARSIDKTNAASTNLYLSWLPSGEIIYQQPGLHNFLRLNVDTQAEAPLLFHDVAHWLPGRPIPSPDGRKIAVMWNNQPERMGVAVISLEDHSIRFLHAGNYYPVGWSADGKLVYAALYDEPEVIQVEVENSRASRLPLAMAAPVANGNAAVSPDGRHLIVAAKEEKSDVWIMKNFDPEVHAAKSDRP